jgi:hypothetical protein
MNLAGQLAVARLREHAIDGAREVFVLLRDSAPLVLGRTSARKLLRSLRFDSGISLVWKPAAHLLSAMRFTASIPG